MHVRRLISQSSDPPLMHQKGNKPQGVCPYAFPFALNTPSVLMMTVTTLLALTQAEVEHLGSRGRALGFAVTSMMRFRVSWFRIS